jgi:hypothetical protein
MLISHFAVRGNSVIPLRFIGVQEGCSKWRSECLYNLTKEMPGVGLVHPAKSTLCASTIESYGYSIR